MIEIIIRLPDHLEHDLVDVAAIQKRTRSQHAAAVVAASLLSVEELDGELEEVLAMNEWNYRPRV